MEKLLARDSAKRKHQVAKATLTSAYLLETVNQLNSSLNIELILISFSTRLQQAMDITYFQYINPEINYSFEQGKKGPFQFKLNLSTDELSLGQIIIHRHIPFRLYDEQLLKKLTQLLAHPLKNGIAHYHALQAALYDPLTHLRHRRSLKEILQSNVNDCHKYHTPLSVLLCDIDDFKAINDTYGHLIGDEVIKKTSQIIQKRIRKTDVAFRIGGEEFLILLPNTSLITASQIAERLRKKIEQTVLWVTNKPIHFTISLGVSCYSKEERHNDLIQQADRALYMAKVLGKNSVCMAWKGIN